MGQVIVPAAVAAVAIASNPQTRNYVSKKYNNVKSRIKKKFDKR